MFGNEADKEARRLEREAEEARERAAREEQQRIDAAQRAEAVRAASPVGRAELAKRNGDAFFEIQLEVGAHIGTAGFGSASGQRSLGSAGQVLGQIEAVGWRLEHVGYYFMLTGETSTAQFFGSGQNTAVSGATIGVYLFRNTDPAAPGVPPPSEPFDPAT